RCNGLDSLYIIFFAYTQNIAYFEEPSNALTRLQTCKIIHDLQGSTIITELVTLVENFNVITKYAHNIKYLERRSKSIVEITLLYLSHTFSRKVSGTFKFLSKFRNPKILRT
ncbi:10474_t:CDS:1, partial [Funneliformis mosseae]